MCIKKEYKCYKDKETIDCCNAKIEEAVRNRTYFLIFILGILLMIIALAIKASDSAAFVNQVSFASTITSIILSVIAIWMSITGERSTNEIKTKVSDSVDKLLNISSESEKLTDLSKVFSDQKESFNKIKDQMESIISEVQGVNTKIESMNDSFIGTKESQAESVPDNAFLFFKNIVVGIPNKETKKMVCQTIIQIFQEAKDGKEITQDKVYDMIDASEGNRHIILGIVATLVHNGFFKDDKNNEKTKKLMDDIGIEK